MLQLANLLFPVVTLNKQTLVLFIPKRVRFAQQLSTDLILNTLESKGIRC